MYRLVPPGALWARACAWACVFVALSAQAHLRFAPDAGLAFFIRKLVPMAFFGILALSFWHALVRTTTLRRPSAWALALTVLYAITDELHQGLVTGRHPSVSDVVIDTVGALIAAALVALVAARQATSRSGPPPPGRSAGGS